MGSEPYIKILNFARSLLSLPVMKINWMFSVLQYPDGKLFQFILKTYINKNCIYVVCAVIALKWCYVRPEIVSCKKKWIEAFIWDLIWSIYLRGTIRTFLFLSRLSTLCPAAQSPMENLGVWLQMNCKRILQISFTLKKVNRYVKV